MNKIFRIVFSKILGIMLFLIMLFIVNRLNTRISGLDVFVRFLNNNAIFLIVMSLLFMIVEITFALPFPINLPAPVFSASVSMMVVEFIFRIFGLIGTLVKQDIYSALSPLRFLAFPVVFIAVLVGGYITIFTSLGKKKEKKSRKDKSWDEIQDELRKGFSDLFRKIADSIEKH